MSTAALLRSCALVLLLVGMAVAAAPATADQTFSVSAGHTEDEPDSDLTDDVCDIGVLNGEGPVCTLRAAIQQANATDGVDTINVPAGLYVLTEDGNGEDAGATGDLDVSSILTIVGAGSGDDDQVDTIIDGFREEINESADRVLDVHSQGILDISDVRIQNGQWGGNGGAVRNFGELTMTDSVVTDSIAGEDGGGFYNHRNGELTLRNVTVSDNEAGWGGGLYNNSDGREPEGDEADSPGLLIEDSTINDNRAQDVGEEVYSGYGGGLFNDDEATILRTTFEDNWAERGGAIYNDVDDNPDLERLNQPGELSITDSTLTLNVADDEGGGIYNDAVLTMVRSTVSVNGAEDDGGGIYNGGREAPLRPPATALITDSTISGNAADGAGGGIYNEELVTLLRSTVSGNGFAELTDETFETDDGGGIFNADAEPFLTPEETLSRATIEIVNSTISGNTAFDQGGGIYNQGVSFDQVELLEVEPVPTVILNHSTVTGNTANVELNGGSPDFWGGGIFNEPVDEEILQPGEVRMMNTIVAGNTAEDGPPPAIVLQAIVGSNCGGKDPVSDGFNLESADSCGLGGPGDLKNTDPKLGSLAANGGPTLSHALLDGSPALDKAGGGSCPTTDQRGTSRPQGPACDIGSYERFFQAPQPQPQPQPAPQPPAATPQPPPAAAPRPRPRAPRAVRRCRVPNVRGKTVAQARRAIARAGCRAVVMGRRFSTTTAPGRVLGQSIRAGRRVRRGTIVRLLIARRVQPVRPPFTG